MSPEQAMWDGQLDSSRFVGCEVWHGGDNIPEMLLQLIILPQAILSWLAEFTH